MPACGWFKNHAILLGGMLLLAGGILYLASQRLRLEQLSSEAQTSPLSPPTIRATLVRTIQTSQFSPPAPDAAGLAYNLVANRLIMSDSEVEEMTIWQGANLFEIDLSGNLLRTANTTSFTNEPTGVAFNAANGHIFISDDNLKRVFEINPGADRLHGTADDTRTFFGTAEFGGSDPEGIAFGQGSLFIAGGIDAEVWRVSPGVNGRFDGVPPGGDDQVTHFDTAGIGLPDPEGIEFNSDTNTLYVVSTNRAMREISLEGIVRAIIDISAINAVKPAGLAYAPSSLNPSAKNIYIAERGVDNNNDPTENDGKIYEISISALPSSGNPADLNADGKVDVIDLGILLSVWGQTTKPKSDINQDGRVDVIDLGILLAKWGS